MSVQNFFHFMGKENAFLERLLFFFHNYLCDLRMFHDIKYIHIQCPKDVEIML